MPFHNTVSDCYLYLVFLTFENLPVTFENKNITRSRRQYHVKHHNNIFNDSSNSINQFDLFSSLLSITKSHCIYDLDQIFEVIKRLKHKMKI